MKLEIELNVWKKTKGGIEYKIVQRYTNWHYLIRVKQGDGRIYCPTEQDIHIMDDDELLTIYQYVDTLNCNDPLIKRHGFPGSPLRKQWDNQKGNVLNDWYIKHGL